MNVLKIATTIFLPYTINNDNKYKTVPHVRKMQDVFRCLKVRKCKCTHYKLVDMRDGVDKSVQYLTFYLVMLIGHHGDSNLKRVH